MPDGGAHRVIHSHAVRDACRTVALLAGFVAAGCAPKARPPLDGGAVPKGVGWHCYQHEAPGTASVGVCYRDRDECGARASDDGGTTCNPVDRAYCTDLHPGANAPDVRCLATAEDCETAAADAVGVQPTRCEPVP
jgi:hypothetical protein